MQGDVVRILIVGLEDMLERIPFEIHAVGKEAIRPYRNRTTASLRHQGPINTMPSKHFHIFGHGISFSKSPAIHTAGFRHYNLPYTYDIREPAVVDEVASLIEDESFGGASVTMPHKLAVHRFCASQTEHARLIGAINTLVVRHHDHDNGQQNRRHILGDNTDWSGLQHIIAAKTHAWPRPPRSGLVIGAGGASRAALYALHQSGVREIAIVNRTRAHAETIAQDFSAIFGVSVVATLQYLATRPEIVIGTIPADKTREENFRVLFEGAGEPGLCIDMSYKPRKTPLLAVAEAASGWDTVAGVEVLLYQAFDQFELWTGLKAPREDMVEVIAESDRQEAEALQGKL